MFKLSGGIIVETYVAAYGTIEIFPKPEDFSVTPEPTVWEAVYTLPENHQLWVRVTIDAVTGSISHTVSDGGAFEVREAGLQFEVSIVGNASEQ